MSKKILVVDDEETLCEALRFNLEAEGYEVDTAHSSEEVLSMDISGYDLILLDIIDGRYIRYAADKNIESQSGHGLDTDNILYGQGFGKRHGGRTGNRRRRLHNQTIFTA